MKCSTAIVPLPERTETQDDGCCMFCGHSSTDEAFCGVLKFDEQSKIRVHYFCALFSERMTKQDEDETIGISGFRPEHIKAEVKRGQKYVCSYCAKNGATIQCHQKACPVKFHMPCGRKNDVLFLFYDQYRAFCADHAVTKFERGPNPKRMGAFFGTGRVMCTICKLYVPSRSSRKIIRSWCCKMAYFHFKCVQNQALNAGEYHFRCPNCNDEETFRNDVLKFGVYIPTRDASWETDGQSGFESLYQRPTVCTAAHCPISIQTNVLADQNYSLVYCSQCGFKAAHFRCAQFEMVPFENSWLCAECRPTCSRSFLHSPPNSLQISVPVGISPGHRSTPALKPKVAVSLTTVTCASNKNDSESSIPEVNSNLSDRASTASVAGLIRRQDSPDSAIGNLIKYRKRKRSPNLPDTDTKEYNLQDKSDESDSNVNSDTQIKSEHVPVVDGDDDCLIINDGTTPKVAPLIHICDSNWMSPAPRDCNMSSFSDYAHSVSDDDDVKVLFCNYNRILPIKSFEHDWLS